MNSDPLIKHDPWKKSGKSSNPAEEEKDDIKEGKKPKKPSIIESLVPLLRQEGMAEKHLINQAKNILHRFGAKSILTALKENDVWNAIKELAKLQHFELIPSFTKARHIDINKFLPSEAKLDVDNLYIKEGDFIDSMSKKPLAFITLNEVRQGATGVTLATALKASAYVSLVKELSLDSLALVIPIFANDTPVFNTPPSPTHNVALYEKHTDKVLSHPCWTMQLGKNAAERACVAGDMFAVSGANTLVFSFHRKDLQEEWREVNKHPVKYVLANIESLTEHCSTIYRVTKDHKQAFVEINAVVKSGVVDLFLKQSGTKGIFVSVHQKDPLASTYRPIWLGQANFAEAEAKQKTDTKCLGIIKMIRKNNDGVQVLYAIRCKETDYARLRPLVTGDANSVFISSRNRYLIAPLPLGTTKQDLEQILKKMSWTYRPLVSTDGVSWLVASESDPPTFVLSFNSGDVTITRQVKPQQKFLASEREQTVFGRSSTNTSLSSVPTSASTEYYDNQLKDCKKNVEKLEKLCQHLASKQEQDTLKLSTDIKSTEARLEAHVCKGLEEVNKKCAQIEVNSVNNMEKVKQEILSEMQRSSQALLEAFQQCKGQGGSSKRKSGSQTRSRSPKGDMKE